MTTLPVRDPLLQAVFGNDLNYVLSYLEMNFSDEEKKRAKAGIKRLINVMYGMGIVTGITIGIGLQIIMDVIL